MIPSYSSLKNATSLLQMFDTLNCIWLELAQKYEEKSYERTSSIFEGSWKFFIFLISLYSSSKFLLKSWTSEFWRGDFEHFGSHLLSLYLHSIQNLRIKQNSYILNAFASIDHQKIAAFMHSDYRIVVESSFYDWRSCLAIFRLNFMHNLFFITVYFQDKVFSDLP